MEILSDFKPVKYSEEERRPVRIMTANSDASPHIVGEVSREEAIEHCKKHPGCWAYDYITGEQVYPDPGLEESEEYEEYIEETKVDKITVFDKIKSIFKKI